MRTLLLILMLASAGSKAAGPLQDLINAATAGETILLAANARFQGNIIIDKPLRLVGTHATTIAGAGTGTVVLIKAPHVTVQGITIQNSGSNLGEFDSGIRIEADHATITNCRIENAGFGIFIRGADRAALRDNTIAGLTNSTKRGNGIHLWKTKYNAICRNSIHEKRDGIYLSYADKNIIDANTVERSRFGIHYMYSHENVLRSNVLSGNTVGATLMFARGCRVEGNRVSKNLRHGMLFKQLEGSLIVGNFISGHNRGLFVQQAAQDRFENNVIAHNDMGLYLSSGSEQNVFVGNSFIDNVDQVWQPADEAGLGRFASNAFFENGRGNFWSDYTGADRNHDGFGDTPYHETGLYGYILDRRPGARLFALSPAASLLRKGEELLPLINTAGVTDLYPRMTSPVQISSK